MSYIENPKTEGSGIVACIPQTGICPNECEDCFFQSGRSYLEPLEDNLPNIPDSAQQYNRVVRVNDGLDSHVDLFSVILDTRIYTNKFYNTACPDDLEVYQAPVVLTLNPGLKTDTDYHRIDSPPENLMFVRFRTNMWNLNVCDQAVDWYSDRGTPIVLTFMAYHDETSVMIRHYYEKRMRIINPYWAITHEGWKRVMRRYEFNRWVYSCGREGITSLCRFCGNCLREYFATMERMREG